MSAKSVLHLLDADIAENSTAVLISGIRTGRAVIFLMVFIAAHATAHAHRAASLFYKKRLTNRSKFAAKPIDYILFLSTGGDFFVTYKSRRPCRLSGYFRIPVP